MSDPAWEAGAVGGNRDWENVTTRRQASERTDVYLLYDDTNLYVGFVAHQPEPIIATQATTDVGFGTDDFVGIGIDTSGSGSQSYMFEVTPRGVHYEQASENARFRPAWRSAAKIERRAWRAVLVVPLNVMRLRASRTQTWRVEFFRGIASRGEHLSWAYDPTMQDLPSGSWPPFSDQRFWPSVSGIALSSAAGKPRPRLELYGLTSSGADRNLYQQAGGTFQPQKTRSFGADFSYPITRTINAVGTLNPDFSNVEIDQQTIAPQEFARQLQEYRPFFAQGAQYIDANPHGFSDFNSPANALFYSPRIGPFDRGAKIEGTYGLQNFGVLSFRGFDETTGDTFDDQAFGYAHALQNRTFQYWIDGVSAHHSTTGSDAAYEAGTRIRNLRSGLDWLFNTGNEEGRRSTYSFLDVYKPNYQAIIEYADIAPRYAPVDGFTTINDVKGFAGYVNLTGGTPGVKNWSFFVQGGRFLDHAGFVHEANSSVFVNATFKNGISINGLGPSTSELRTSQGELVPFNLMIVPIGFGDGTPTPVDVSANWGSFGGNWLHFYTASTSRPLGSKYTLGVEYDGSYERSLASGALQSQFLRRVSFGLNMGSSSNLSISLRDINGLGGFSPQTGLNLAAAFHTWSKSGDLYINFGSPSAFATIHRTIVKYVWRLGADSGT